MIPRNPVIKRNLPGVIDHGTESIRNKVASTTVKFQECRIISSNRTGFDYSEMPGKACFICHRGIITSGYVSPVMNVCIERLTIVCPWKYDAFHLQIRLDWIKMTDNRNGGG